MLNKGDVKQKWFQVEVMSNRESVKGMPMPSTWAEQFIKTMLPAAAPAEPVLAAVRGAIWRRLEQWRVRSLPILDPTNLSNITMSPSPTPTSAKLFLSPSIGWARMNIRQIFSHQQHLSVEEKQHFRSWDSRLHLAKCLEVLHLHVGGHLQGEHCIREGGHCHLHASENLRRLVPMI